MQKRVMAVMLFLSCGAMQGHPIANDDFFLPGKVDSSDKVRVGCLEMAMEDIQVPEEQSLKEREVKRQRREVDEQKRRATQAALQGVK